MKNFEAICVSYPNEDSSSSTYLSILFWRGLSSHGFSNILTVGSLIACSNLEYRRTRNPMWNIPICYCSERTVFTQNPRQPHLLEVFEDLKRRICVSNFFLLYILTLFRIRKFVFLFIFIFYFEFVSTSIMSKRKHRKTALRCSFWINIFYILSEVLLMPFPCF